MGFIDDNAVGCSPGMSNESSQTQNNSPLTRFARKLDESFRKGDVEAIHLSLCLLLGWPRMLPISWNLSFPATILRE